MTHREFLSWCVFYQLSPFDDERCFDAPAARVAEQVSISRKGKARFKDFLPHRDTKVGKPAQAKKAPGQLSANELKFLNKPIRNP